VTGYLHGAYAAALKEFGTPIYLPSCNGWVLERSIPGSTYRDAMGCYPLFCCQSWNGISEDLRSLAGHLVSLVLVADPFGDYKEAELRAAFDIVNPFKEHLVVDLCARQGMSRHHRYYARRALRFVTLEVAENVAAHSDEFADLFAILARRHDLEGIKAFSRQSLTEQMRVPGVVLFRALQNDTVVGAHLWMVQRNVAYSHLLAMEARGYAVSASYALYQSAIEYFRGKVRWLDLGSGAGAVDNVVDGLYAFKSGWANTRRVAYLCGARLNHDEYRRLTPTTPNNNWYFPAYRAGELTTSGRDSAEELET
jgi:hypothetical protein